MRHTDQFPMVVHRHPDGSEGRAKFKGGAAREGLRAVCPDCAEEFVYVKARLSRVNGTQAQGPRDHF